MFRETQIGLFWLPDRPSRVVDGTLSVDDTGRLELTTQELVDLSESDNPGGRKVLGTTQKGQVTLIDALIFDLSHRFDRHLPAQYQESWHCYYAYQGESYEGDLDGDIVAVEVEIQTLSEWAYDGRNLNLDRGSGTLSWPTDAPKGPVGRWSLGEVSVQHGYNVYAPGRQRRLSAVNVVATTSFVVKFDQPQSVADVKEVVGSLQALVSIAKGDAVKVERVALTVNTGEAEERLLLHFEPVLIPTNPARKNSELFSMKELGGIEGVGRWLDVLHEQTHARNGLLIDKYQRPAFITDTTGHLLLAHEAYERHTALYTRQRSTARKSQHVQTRKVLDLALGSASQELLDWTGDQVAWKKKISSVRVEQVAHLENYGNISVDAGDVYALNRQLYTLLVVRILSQCGLSEELLDKIVGRSRANAVVRLP